MDKVNWKIMSLNESMIDILEENIDYEYLSANKEIDYEYRINENCFSS